MKLTLAEDELTIETKLLLQPIKVKNAQNSTYYKVSSSEKTAQRVQTS